MTQSKKYLLIIFALLTVIIIAGYLLINSNFLNQNIAQESNIESNIILPPAIQLLRNYVAFQNLTGEDNVKVISFKEVTWSDSCLEIQSKDEICTTIKVSGYEATVTLGNTKHTYHLNSDAGIVREVIR